MMASLQEGTERTLIDDLVEEAKEDLTVASKTRDAAAELLSRLLTRPDLQSQYLTGFLAWSTEILMSTNDVFLVCVLPPPFRAIYAHPLSQRTGVLTALTGIFKLGKRDVLLNLIPLVFESAKDLMNGSLIQRKVQ